MALSTHLSLSLLFLLLILSLTSTAFSTRTSSSLTHLTSSLHAESDECVYTVYIRTSTILKGGTDSTISLTLYTKNGDGVLIRDLEAWGGLMGSDHDYFERGNLDIFSGRGPCLSEIPVCYMNLTSDGQGAHHGWYCNYVEVTTTGPHGGCHQEYFEVEQWLATDTSPYELTAIRDQCVGLSSGTGLGSGSGSGSGSGDRLKDVVV